MSSFTFLNDEQFFDDSQPAMSESKEAGEIEASGILVENPTPITPMTTGTNQPQPHRPLIQEVEEKAEVPPTVASSPYGPGGVSSVNQPSPAGVLLGSPNSSTSSVPAASSTVPPIKSPPQEHQMGVASTPPTIQQPQSIAQPSPPSAYQELGPASIFNQPVPPSQPPPIQQPPQQPTPIVQQPQQQPSYQSHPQQYHPNPQSAAQPHQFQQPPPIQPPPEQEGQAYAPQPQSQYQPQQPYGQSQPQQLHQISPYAQHQLMHGEGQPLPYSNQYYQQQPGYVPSPYSNASYSQQFPNATPPSNGSYPAVHPPPQPQPPQPQVPYHQHPPQANVYGTVAALPKNNPYASANPSPAAVEAANKAGIPLGLPVQPAMGELICPYCSVRLRYPLGSELVRCGGCQSISRIPPSAMNQPAINQPPMNQPPINYQHPVAAPQYQQPIPPPQQPVLPPPPQPSSGSTRVQFRCSGCQIWLAADMSAGGGVTRCPKCQTLMRPLLNMPPPKAPAPVIKGPIPPPGVAPPTKQQLEQEQMMRDYYIANNIPYPLEGQQSVAASGNSSSWLQQQHEKVIKQQEELLARAKANKGQPQPVGVGGGAQQPVPQRKRSVPGDYSSVSHLDFQNNPASSVVSPYNPAAHSYQPQQQQQQQQHQQQPVYPSMHHSGPVHSDYVAAPSVAGPSVAWGSNPGVVPSAYARPSSSSVSSQPSASSSSIHPTPPASASELKDEREKEAEFQAQMAARLEALHVDSEEARVDGEGVAAGAYKPPKPRELRADEKSRPLLANEL